MKIALGHVVEGKCVYRLVTSTLWFTVTCVSTMPQCFMYCIAGSTITCAIRACNVKFSVFSTSNTAQCIVQKRSRYTKTTNNSKIRHKKLKHEHIKSKSRSKWIGTESYCQQIQWWKWLACTISSQSYPFFEQTSSPLFIRQVIALKTCNCCWWWLIS